MKTLYGRVAAIRRLYKSLDNSIAGFRRKTGLTCLTGCSSCCRKPDIEAYPSEFLPFAYNLYKRGELYSTLERITAYPGYGICQLYNPFHATGSCGGCSFYSERGLICRLFGFAARVTKSENLELVTCRHIKENQPDEFIITTNLINRKLKVPVFRDYYMQLANIDPNNSGRFYPLNTAIRKSLEYVAFYYSYRGKKAG